MNQPMNRCYNKNNQHQKVFLFIKYRHSNMNRGGSFTFKKAMSNKTDNSNGQKLQQAIVISTGAKIHRANILARIVHSISLYKMQWAMRRIKILASDRGKCYQKMGLAINRIFRRHFHQDKFNALQKIKRQLIEAEQHQIVYSQKVIQSMSKASRSIIFLILKAKRRQVVQQAFQKIKIFSIQAYHQKRTNQRKAIRKIIQFVMKDKKSAFNKLSTSRYILQKKQKLRNLSFVLSSFRKNTLSWGLWKLRKHLIDKRREQVQQDIKIFEQKINNIDDPQLLAIKQKKDKLQQHLNRVQQQKNLMQEEYMSEYRQLQNHRKQMEIQTKTLEQKKLSLQTQIAETHNQINSPYSMDQIYQCVFHNFLLYLSENREKVYNKQEVLNSLTFPLIPIDVPIDIIKQQNKVMQELLNEYIVMFGPKKLEGEVRLPYQFLVKQNQVMYKMLLTLLPKVESDRDDLRVIRDSLFKLNQKVGQIWEK